MEVVIIVGEIVILILLVVSLLRRGGAAGDGAAEAKMAELAQTAAKTDERLIRIESAVEKLAPTLSDEFRESRKEINENLQSNRKEISGSLQLSRKELGENLQRVRTTLDTRVQHLETENAKKLEEMRQTVDEKLQASVEKRFNESFKTISGQLTQVYKGLGEMQTLATGVGDLKKVMEGVKTRGIYGEVQLGSIISDILTTGQYEENVVTKKGSSDRVEFAIKMPGKDQTVYLPIDSKFPVENYSRLVAAYDAGDKAEIAKLQKALATDVKTQAKKISTKYIDVPHTTDYAVMFLPTESLAAEVLRIPGLVDEIRQKYSVAVVSPSTLPAVLSSVLMGFRTVAIEKRTNEVWQTLGAVKAQFGKFGDLLEGVQKKLQESANKIESAKTTSRSIERKLKGVEALPEVESVKLIGEVGGSE